MDINCGIGLSLNMDRSEPRKTGNAPFTLDEQRIKANSLGGDGRKTALQQSAYIRGLAPDRDVDTSTNFFSLRTAVGFPPNLHLILLLPACLFASPARLSLHPGFRVLTPAPPSLLVNRDHRQRPGRDISQVWSPRLLPACATRLTARTATARAMDTDFKDRLLARLRSSSAQQPSVSSQAPSPAPTGPVPHNLHDVIASLARHCLQKFLTSSEPQQLRGKHSCQRAFHLSPFRRPS